MKSEKIKTHFGVYGICLQNSNILCIMKNRGPYKGRFDLPGGSQEYNESLVETLCREVMEETGQEVNNEKSLVTLDFFVEVKNNFIVHHIAVLFCINISNNQLNVPSVVNDGINDSLGCIWVNVKELNNTKIFKKWKNRKKKCIHRLESIVKNIMKMKFL